MPVTLTINEKARLREFLQDHFNLNELKELSFDLGVNYESFPHQTTSEFTRELIDHFAHRDQLSCLIIEILSKRSGANFMAAWLTKLHQCASQAEVTERASSSWARK